jgi:Leucine-rich repeat (LRR) protein
MKLEAFLVFVLFSVGLIYGEAAETKELENVICKKCNCNADKNIIDCSKKGLKKMFSYDDWAALNATNDSYEELLMDHNNIESIDVQFPPLKFPLKRVILSNNKINKIAKSAFGNLTYLEELDLSYNEMTAQTLKPDIFKGKYSADEYEPIVTLKILRLGNNLLHYLADDLFEHTQHIQELYLDNNPIQVIHPNIMHAFSDISQLQVLDLSRNELTDLPSAVFQPVKALRVLNLEGNLFNKIPRTALKYAQNLRELSFDDNPIDDLNDMNAFPSLPKLEKLNLTHIGSMRSIGEGAFGGFPKLTELHLSNNHHLSFIHPDAFQFPEQDDDNRTQWAPVKKLFLNNNNLTSLESNSFITWDDMTEIHIHDNPWLCDCNLNYVLKHLMPIINQTTKHLIDHIQCAEPSVYAGHKLIDFKSTDFEFRCMDKYNAHPERDSALLVALFLGIILGMPLTCACILIYQRLFRPKQGAAKYSRAFYKRADMQDDMHI